MGSCCGNDAPTPPNPTATAAAQTGTNVSTAIANSYLGNMNQKTPAGSLSNDVTGTFSYTDPTTGQSYTIPRWTTTQSVFNPTSYLNQNPDVMAWAKASGLPLEQAAQQHYDTFGQYENRSAGWGQETFNQGQQTQQNLATMAANQSGALKDFLSQPFDASSGAPGAADLSWLYNTAGAANQISPGMGYQSTYGSGGNIQDSYNAGGDITRSYGPADNFSADRKRVEDALMARLNPQLELENDRVRQRLADQGIRAGQGFDAYDAGMDVYNRQANDARFAAIQNAGQEQQRMNEMARNQAMFQNSAQAQANQQNAALAAFGNQAQAQREGQNAARSAFYNAASGQYFNEQQARANFYNAGNLQNFNRAAQIFGSANDLRNQYLAEQYQARQQPINEITALMSGGQVSQPSFVNQARTQIPTTDVAGIINQNFAQQADLYKTNQQFWGDIIGGTLGAAGNVGKGWMMSDVRAKENIEPMGTVFSAKGKLPIYEYQYKNDPDGNRHVGPMAQDVERLDPDAVKEIGGVKYIKLDRMGSIFGGARHG